MSPAQIRTYMEQAVNVMRQSIEERRNDGKASPKVGAVLVKRDGTFVTAYRGELRDGDHAEFTLLERKHRDEKLDDAVLFATLEPCAPKARKFPKLSCAERIVLARIRKVWVGIEDPDPTVDRKGIKFLQDAGIEVYMFDRDLQEIIREENKTFLKQAAERAASTEEEQPKPPLLSPLEKAVNHSLPGDLSREALEHFREAAGIDDLIASPGFQRQLAGLGLLEKDGNQLRPTGFGLILFGKQPRNVMPQAALLGTIHYANGKEEARNFDGPQVLVPGQVDRWLRDKLPSVIDRSKGRRHLESDALFEMVREGVVNALVHRNYDIGGAKSHLVVTPDSIEIRSPGGPVNPLTLEQLQSFTAPMLSRNPALHYVFSQAGWAEERGLGLKSMRSRAQEAGLPLPRYSWDDPYLVLTIYRSTEGIGRTLPPAVTETLSSDERGALELLARIGTFSSPVLMERMNFDERKAQRVLRRLTDLNLIRRIGKGRQTRYELV